MKYTIQNLELLWKINSWEFVTLKDFKEDSWKRIKNTSSHVWMWDLDHKASWGPRNWCFWTVVLEKTLESPLDCKEIQPAHPKGNQAWIFTGRRDAEAETLILWPTDAKNWLIGKDPDTEKDWRQEEGMTQDEMVGWHHWLKGHEFEQAPGVGDGQGSLVCCSPWGRKESDTTEQLNWTELIVPKGRGSAGMGEKKLVSWFAICCVFACGKVIPFLWAPVLWTWSNNCLWEPSELA